MMNELDGVLGKPNTPALQHSVGFSGTRGLGFMDANRLHKKVLYLPLLSFIHLYWPLFGKTVTLQEVGGFRFVSGFAGLRRDESARQDGATRWLWEKDKG
jgi:hypothetical protein